jgi:hypothetical protein
MFITYGYASSEGPGIELRCVRDFPQLPATALGPIKPLIKWVPGSFPGGKQSGRSVDHRPHPAPRLKKV